MPTLPTGTVTFLFTDIEGSTRLLQRLGERYPDVLTEYRQLLRSAIQRHGGQEINTWGDSIFVAFPEAYDAVETALGVQRGLSMHSWPEGVALRVRMGLHTGRPLLADTGYLGLDVHRAARICTAGRGGQILLSERTRDLVAEHLPAGVSLRDLGEHRLKDMPQSDRLFQLVAPDLPLPDHPLGLIPHNLPIYLTSFVGRNRDVAAVVALLANNRLVTLTGSGGTGKTRLAVRVAQSVLNEFPDGVWLVELGALSEADLIPHTVASVLGIREQPDRSVLDFLFETLSLKHALLILDNCEHLIADCGRLSEALLRSCGNLTILATSREALGIGGEAVWLVPSLSLPDPRQLPDVEALNQYEAIRLFVDRATLCKPGFTITASTAHPLTQTCVRLGGIPLAIEMAAARIKVLTVEQIAARLDDQFRLLKGGSRTALPRHQTLQATMDWSYHLLSREEQAVFRSLAVFAGGWTLEAAEGICPAESLTAPDILDLLSNLVDKSLVLADAQVREVRYRFLETVRQYAQTRLFESQAASDVRRRHRDWYLHLAEQAEPHLGGPDQDVWLQRLETEHDNLRAALEWSIADGDAEAALRLVGALQLFWDVRGHWAEGRRWLEEVLAKRGDAPTPALSKALEGAADLARRQGDYDRAVALCERGLTVCRALGDRQGYAQLLINMGLVAIHQEAYERATAVFQESLAIGRDLEDKLLLSTALGQLAVVALAQHQYEEASVRWQESLDHAQALGHKRRTAYALFGLGTIALRQDDPPRAAALLRDSLSLCGRLGIRWLTEVCLEGLAGVACALGNYAQATRLLGAAEVLSESLDLRLPPPYQSALEQWVAASRAGLPASTFAALWAEGRAMTLEQAITYALAVDGS